MPRQVTVGSLFAGIGGFDLGFEREGCKILWQVEHDRQACAVLMRRFPTVRLYHDVRAVGSANLDAVDVICGGFPCQDVSVAGTHAGLSGARTGLFWEVVRIARELDPRWMVLENVPGLLSSHGGRDFHTVLSALAELGFRRAYRILDSQYFGVPQRRRRVFIVLRARRCGDGAEAVLFESASGNQDSETGEEAREDVATTLRGRSHSASVNLPGRGGEDDQNLVYTLRSNERNSSQGPGNYVPTGVATLRCYSGPSGNGLDPLIAFDTTQITSRENRSNPQVGDPCHTLAASAHAPAIAYSLSARPNGIGQGHNTTYPGGVRQLTLLECERLQGFPDGWTCLCGNGHRGSQFCTCGYSHRYRQLGNAVTVPVAAWIARRLVKVHAEGLDHGTELRAPFP